MKQEKDDIINIFSVASGHLYERFLRLVFVICIEMNFLQYSYFVRKVLLVVLCVSI